MLLRDITAWRERQLLHLPDLQAVINSEPTDNAHPKRLRLLLPSDFDAEQREELGLTSLAKMERDLREGQAHDALAAVRRAVHATGMQEEFTVHDVRGQHAKTRADSEIKKLKDDARGCAAQYRAVREALVGLGMSDDDAMFKPLLDKELWMKGARTAHRLGDGTREEPWYWHMGPSGIRTDAEREAWVIDGM
jgi:hypothetical protein